MPFENVALQENPAMQRFLSVNYSFFSVMLQVPFMVSLQMAENFDSRWLSLSR